MARLLLAHICLASASYVSWHAPQQRSLRSPHPTSVASLIAPPDARPVPTKRHTVDAEVMLGDLQRYGMRIVAKPEEADIVIVNTCAFVEDAKRESIAAIVDAAHLKDDDALPTRGLFVTGCMAQRYAQELADELP